MLQEMVQEVNSYNGDLEYLSVYLMDNFDDILCNLNPTVIAQMIQFGKFNIHDDYFNFNGYGNLVSRNHDDLMAEIEDEENYIIETYFDTFGDDELYQSMQELKEN